MGGESIVPDVKLDAFGLICPIPISRVAKTMRSMEVGEVLEALADDPGFANDLPMWCKSAGQEFISMEEKDGEFRGLVRKIK